MRTQPTIISWRCVLALLTVMASLSLLAAGGAIAAPSEDQSTISVAIPIYIGVDAEDISGPWHKGITDEGDLGDPGGDNPAWSGGTIDDMWPSDGKVAFCYGAVARSKVTVRSNAPCTVNVTNVPTKPGYGYPTLSQGDYTLLYIRTLAWKRNEIIKPGLQREWTSHPGEDSSTWLYACVERKGLQDHAGTYTDTFTVEAWTN